MLFVRVYVDDGSSRQPTEIPNDGTQQPDVELLHPTHHAMKYRIHLLCAIVLLAACKKEEVMPADRSLN